MNPNSANRGMSLVECAAALVLAGLLVAELGRSLQASASMLATAKQRSATVDVARNLLESEIGAPCGPPYQCPSNFRCEISRSSGVYAGLDRVRATTTPNQASAGTGEVELAVLVRPVNCS